ncbi:sodium:proton antiporter NhaD [Botrimarina mediterranea]|uniref:Na(+)/H(+) antiporter NhaD n=1 Tax=Botrimarina mediterranea TaxID=2528022 RepID=A0A518K6L0_9BACT|nr:sodium:proton antiporter NhaD [Botrimarina mediterranea]QDV73432.1 Na(+)/H(+) antiporter NhaD [Botrimarina mediterranea]QDV77949.1 Na(+)/H(+) antiporter NhaD [Planctomycetes bacterium K2D]
MYFLVAAIFILGYFAIVFEHQLGIDKAAAALVTGVLCWTLYMFSGVTPEDGHHALLENFSEISSILFFLLGAMTIVEVVDVHGGFNAITDRIQTKSLRTLLWIVAWLSFFLSAVLDNMTTSIVMISLLRKLIADKEQRWLFAGVVIIAANAGGAWSPIGDVTTTMLWIGNQITTGAIISKVFFPSVVSLVVPLVGLSMVMKGELQRPKRADNTEHTPPLSKTDTLMVLIAGVGGLLFVPVFKTITHLPPFMGMMLSLGVLWLLVDTLHRRKTSDLRKNLAIAHVLRRVDVPSVLFFLGILLAVAALQTGGQLSDLATLLDQSVGTETETGVLIIGGLIGALSSIVDNVPLVAAAMGMYPIDEAGFFAQDGLFWEYLAYCAGTGGSILIVGSAAGVAVMGLEKIPFLWYLRNVSALALVSYLSGISVYVIMHGFWGVAAP